MLWVKLECLVLMVSPVHLSISFRYNFARMTDSVFSVHTMINLVQKLRQEKADCEDVISQTKNKARVMERRVEEVARQLGIATTAMEEKMAMMAVLQGRVEPRQKMFNQVKQKGDMTQATV